MNKEPEESDYAFYRRNLMSSVYVTTKIRNTWENMEKALGRALSIPELNLFIGCVDEEGSFTAPIQPILNKRGNK